MTPQHIYSAKSDFVRHYLPTKRRKDGLVLAEGERVVIEALAGSWRCIQLFAERHFAESDAAGDVLKAVSRAGVQVALLEARAMEKLSGHATAPPVAVLVEPPDFALPEALPARTLVLDGVADPGNAGTLLRTAAAFGFGCVFVQGGVTHLNEKFLRSTAGQIFREGVYLGTFARDEISAKLSGAEVLVLDSHADEILREPGLDRAVALVMGNEARGVELGAWNGARAVRIPMRPGVESLNVAISGAIAMYELGGKGAR